MTHLQRPGQARRHVQVGADVVDHCTLQRGQLRLLLLLLRLLLVGSICAPSRLLLLCRLVLLGCRHTGSRVLWLLLRRLLLLSCELLLLLSCMPRLHGLLLLCWVLLRPSLLLLLRISPQRHCCRCARCFFSRLLCLLMRWQLKDMMGSWACVPLGACVPMLPPGPARLMSRAAGPLLCWLSCQLVMPGRSPVLVVSTQPSHLRSRLQKGKRQRFAGAAGYRWLSAARGGHPLASLGRHSCSACTFACT